MALAPGTLQDNIKNATRSTAIPGQTAVAVVNPDGSTISGGGGGTGGATTINTTSVSGAISVGTTPVEAKVGVSRLTSRLFVLVTAVNGTIYFGSDNTVTTSTGTPIIQNQPVSFSFTDNVPVWLVADTTVDVRVMEGA